MGGERSSIRRLLWSRSRESVGLATRLRIRYWIVMVGVSVLALLTLRAHDSTLRAVTRREEQITSAVQIRTLLQQIRSLAHALSDRVDKTSQSPSPVEVDQFSNLVEQMRTLHADLRDRGGSVPPLEDREVIALFEGSTTAIRTRTDAFLTAASSLPTFLNPGEASASRRRDLLLQMDRLADPVDGPLYRDLETVIKTLNERIEQLAEDASTTNQVLAVTWLVAAGLAVAVAFRPIARAVDQETTELREAERRQRESVERQIFHNELNQALEGAENEEEILEAVGRAVQEIVPDNPAELLLIDATQAHLRQVKVHPTRGAPNCPVDSPHACAAIRRGQTVRYQTSRALNVCPKLTQHEAAPCSGLCAPVVFLGRSIGVLHVIGEDMQPFDDKVTERLNVLARETGNRLGTMRASQQTELQASTDGLTGLPNRRNLEQRVRELMLVDRPFALAIADLDHFKNLNDTYGHEAGDVALKLFARTLRQNLRPDDIAARYGGEEFVLVLPNTSVDEAKRAIDRLRVALAGEIAAAGGVPFTASWGLTSSSAATSFEEMIKIADEALYAAKRAGRNRVVVAGAEPRLPDESTEMAETHHAGGHPLDGVETLAGDAVSGERGTSVSLDAGGPANSAEGTAVRDVEAAACPQCGYSNPMGSRFCLECGERLEKV